MSRFELNADELERLQRVMKEFPGNTETVINEILHTEAGELLKTEIKRLMPESGRNWAGKKKAARSANSLRVLPGNLSVTVTTTKAYQYLYFPDDGTSTKKHAGNQQFFQKSGETQQKEIIDRCISGLMKRFNDAS